jgi:hypothetical protein
MTNSQTARWIILLAASLSLISFVGCNSRDYQIGEVEGVVLIGGKPASNIFVQFIPEVGGEASPPPSNAQTDSAGHFALQLIEPNGSVQPGAAVGMHRVVLRDLQAAMSPASNATRIRVPVQYTMPGSTPLTEEVKEGNQTIEIQVPSK